VERVCENCAAPDDELEAVRRVYVAGAASSADQVLDDVEVWCFSCRSLYPHEPVDEG
jgi:hypothetical protein